MKFIRTKAAQIPVSNIIPILTAMNDRDYLHFKELQTTFISQHGVEVWQDFFNFRVLPALDQESHRWLLEAWCTKDTASATI